jgi:hypothetical protein
MLSDSLFSEQQRFKQPWIWLLLLAINTWLIYGLIRQVVYRHPFGQNPLTNGGLLALAVFSSLLTTLFAVMRLDTAIRRDGIYYRFLPFQITWKKIGWERIAAAYVREYQPVSDYGGWGMRLGMFGNGEAFNISGNHGLQLEYDNGKKFLLGTQKPLELERVLKSMGKLDQK